MWRMMRVFFAVSFISGVISLVFLLFYSVRYNTNGNNNGSLKVLALIKARLSQGGKTDTVQQQLHKDNVANKQTISTTSVARRSNNGPSTPTILAATNPSISPSKSPSKSNGDSVDQLIETSLEKSKTKSHGEGDEPDPSESSEDNVETEAPTNIPATSQPGENQNHSAVTPEEDEDLELCPAKPQSLTGPLYVNQNIPKMEELEKHFSEAFGGWVQKGGAWRPTHCKARVKMALIVPFRKRYEQLGIFVRHMHPMLKRQELDYRIIIVEQSGTTPFNRAILFNIGYKEALKFTNFNCLIFHDVDLIPEDDRNMYSCPTSPRHMSVAVDKFNYRLPYSALFGGAGAFSKKDFDEINGFSNKFWGWGGEDDDLYQRVVSKGHHLTRPSLQIGRYKMIRIHHHQSSKADPNSGAKIRNARIRMLKDGLNSLKYTVLKLREEPMYTMVTIAVDPKLV